MRVGAGMCGTGSASRSHPGRAIAGSIAGLAVVLSGLVFSTAAAAQDLPGYEIRADDPIMTMTPEELAAVLEQLAGGGGGIVFAANPGDAFLRVAASGKGGPGVTVAPSKMASVPGYWEPPGGDPAGAFARLAGTTDWRARDLFVAHHGGYSLAIISHPTVAPGDLVAPVPKSRTTLEADRAAW